MCLVNGVHSPQQRLDLPYYVFGLLGLELGLFLGAQIR